MHLFPCRACRHWSAPYDGVNPLPEQYRSDTPGNNIEDEEELIQRAKSDSISSLAISPPPMAFSPTPSSSDTVSTGNQTGRASSALELEWDDIFADEDQSLSGALNKPPTNGSVIEVDKGACTPAPPPLPPRHIQEMRRTATKLVHGSYVEESEFQDDVLVYDLVAQKDAKTAILERIMAANRQARKGVSNSHRASTATTGRTVMETVNSIMSTRRRSEDVEKEERRWCEDYGKEVRRRSEDCGKETWRRKLEGEDEIKRTEEGDPRGRQFITNGFKAKNHVIDECEDIDEDGNTLNREARDLAMTVNHIHTQNQQHTHHNTQHLQSCSVTGALPNGHSESEPHDHLITPSLPVRKVTTNDGFLSRYRELMLSLGEEPDCDDITDDISTFRKRVRALRRKLEEVEEGLGEDFFLRDIQENDGEEEAMDEDEEEAGGEERSCIKEGNRKHGVPFTGQYFKTRGLFLLQASVHILCMSHNLNCSFP